MYSKRRLGLRTPHSRHLPITRTIYLLDAGDRLIEMREQAYDSEDKLQRLLATHLNPPRRRADGSREMPVPRDAGMGGRWSLDHLFVDPEGVPALVEVKRGSNDHIRREGGA